MSKYIPSRPCLPNSQLEILKNCILKRNTFLKSESIVVFVCGAGQKKDYHSGRDFLMQYAQRHLSHMNFFMAEDIFPIFYNKYNYDFLTIERKLADYSDCIIIVLESEGAFAELGAFTIEDKLAEIVLVVNSHDFKNSQSFINYGPINKVNKKSIFGPAIYTNLESILAITPEIEQRLNKIKKEKNKRIDLSTFDNFTNCSAKVRLLFILDLINLCSPINHHELIYLLISFYGKNRFEIRLDLSLLQALKLVKKTEDGYFFKASIDKNLFFEYKGVNELIIRALIVNYYHKYFRDKIEMLKKRIG